LQRYHTELVSSTVKEVISARNSIDAHAQDFVVNGEWMLPIFRALAQCTRSLEVFDVLSLYSSRTVAPTNGSLVPPNRARHAHHCGDHLIFCHLYFGANKFEYKLPDFLVPLTLVTQMLYKTPRSHSSEFLTLYIRNTEIVMLEQLYFMN
jgi:hypothetical protein